MGIGFGYGLSISIEKALVNASAHVFMLAPASGVMTKYSLLPFRWQFGDHWAWAPQFCRSPTVAVIPEARGPYFG